MKKLNVAIIGQGRSGRDIHGAFLHTEEAKERFTVVAIVEEIPSRAERAKAEFGVPVFEKYTDLFDCGLTIDLVVNSSYSYLHAPISIDLLEHGFNVLCEKPAAHNTDEFDAMCAAAEKSGKFLGIFQQSRFAPYYVQVKKVIDSGVLGRLVDVDIRFNGYARRWDWQTVLANNGGSLRNTGPHPLDQALNILNDYDHMPTVFCKMDYANTFGDAEDYCKLILTAPEKPLIDLTISCCDGYPTCTYKIHGTRGSLKGDMQHIEWKYYDHEHAPRQELVARGPISKPDGTPAYCSEKLEWTTESWEGDPNGAFDSAVAAYYKDMYEFLTEGKPMEVQLFQVRQQIAVYQEAHRQNGHTD
ncbi:MAG: Gfo/Idh/MocA family oxidoreductase [Lachnospiraceae bacterium]|nr:Gfo/Idh/MocA family oxidoreductase [Lachnospiraceae bacterium]